MNDWFCPLIGKKCNTSCVCHKPRKIVAMSKIVEGKMQVVDVVVPEHCINFHGDLSK